MPAHDFLTDLAAASLDVLSELAERFSSLEFFERLLIRHGWQTPDSRTYFADVQAAFDLLNDVPALIDTVQVLRSSPEPDLTEVANALQAVVALLDDIETLASSGAHPNLPSPIGGQAFWSTFPRDVIQTEIILYLAARKPGTHAVLRLFGIIDEETVAADPAAGRMTHRELRLRWDRLGGLIGDPRQLMADVYGWGGTLEHAKLLRNVDAALSGFGVPAEPQVPTDTELTPFYDAGSPFRSLVRNLRVPFLI